MCWAHPGPTIYALAAMAISTNQFKNGTHIEVDGTIYRILEFQHVKPGKGGAFVRTRLRKLDDGSVSGQDVSRRGEVPARPDRTRRMQYLYDAGETAVFMDTRDYEQLELPRGVAGEAMRGCSRTPRSRCSSSTSARPEFRCRARSRWPSPRPSRASRATRLGGGTKPATLESGVRVEVPLFVNEGDRVRVDTRSGEYVSRA